MDYGKKNEKRGKRKTHTIGPVIWRVKLKNVENEKCTLQDLEYGDKPGKRKKMRNSQGRAFNMARNTKKGGK